MTTSTATRYVAGFLFTPDLESVVLVRKQRPAWQAGKLNGVGGHIEPGETGPEAMRREFREEAGVDLDRWEHFATLTGEGFEVEFYRADGPEAREIDVTTDEFVGVWNVSRVTEHGCISNVPWLLRMAIPTSRHDWPYLVAERCIQVAP